MGVLMGGKAPPMPKNGHFKAEGLNIGWVGKIRNNRNFRIIGQGKLKLLCPINSIKLLIIKKL